MTAFMHVSYTTPAPADLGVLGSDSWLEWVASTTGLKPERVSIGADGSPAPRIDLIWFVDKRGRVQQPSLMPYLPMAYRSTQTDRNERLYRQWTLVAGLLAQEIAHRGLVKYISLPPGIIDGRPFLWAGFNVETRYTFLTPLPINYSQIDSSVRKRIRQASESGYVVERTDDWNAITECVRSTEARQDFSTHLRSSDLASASEVLGADLFRGYVVRDASGFAASGGIRLHSPGHVAIDWLQGTMRDRLRDGVNQLMYSGVFEDLALHGARAFDYTGANIAPVAAAKATWGVPLVPYLRIGAYDLRHAYRTARSVRRWILRTRTHGTSTPPRTATLSQASPQGRAPSSVGSPERP